MGFMKPKAPKPPEPTAEELAMTARQKASLDKEIEEEEKRLKAVARGGLGTRSMLAAATPMGAKSTRKAGPIKNRSYSLPSMFGGGTINVPRGNRQA
jgi:hypothetical protein